MLRTEPITWVVAGSARALAHIEPLICAHRNFRPVRSIDIADFCDADLNDAGGALLVGDSEESPYSALPGPFLLAGNGRKVPIGWLPDIPVRIERFAQVAAEVVLRSTSGFTCGPFVVLGESEERALAFAGRLAGELPEEVPRFQWTAERIRRCDLIAALQSGVGAAFYVGRGTPRGWVAYGGFDASDADESCGCPMGAVFSLTCSVACRRQTSLSFCEEMVLAGLTAASFGAIGLTQHSDNVKLGLAIAQALRRGAITVGEALLDAAVAANCLSQYRIVGDPLAPLIGHLNSLEKSLNVFAPAPDEELPVIPLASWT